MPVQYFQISHDRLLLGPSVIIMYHLISSYLILIVDMIKQITKHQASVQTGRNL